MKCWSYTRCLDISDQAECSGCWLMLLFMGPACCNQRQPPTKQGWICRDGSQLSYCSSRKYFYQEQRVQGVAMLLEQNLMTLWWGYTAQKPAEICDPESSFQCFILMSNWPGRVMPGVTQCF